MYNIFKYKKYEKIKTENGWTVKSVLWKKSSDGEIAWIKNLNSGKKPVYCTTYSDENFENIILTTKIEYDDDKSYTAYYTYEQNTQSWWQSSIITYDNKDRPIFCKWYEDKDFKNLAIEESREYNKNSNYRIKSKDYINSSLSFYNQKGVKNKVITYKDKDFKEIEYCANVKYLKNGNVIYYYLQDNVETLYNNDEKWEVISEKQYKKEGFKDLDYTYFYKYYDDGSYERKTVYANTQKDDPSKCIIEKFDKNDKITERRDYKDKNGKKLYYITTYEYPKENVTTRTYTKLQRNEYLSMQYEKDKTGNYLWVKWYCDKDFKKLNTSEIIEYYDDNTEVRKIIFEKTSSHNLSYSKIEKYKDNKLISEQYYEDREFKNLGRIDTYETNENGEYIIKERYLKPKEDDEYASKITIMQEDNVTPKQKLYYSDDNFTELYAKDECFYTKNSKQFSKSVFIKPRNKIMSAITYKNGKNYKAIAFHNNDFTNLYRKTWGKFNKKDEEIRLRIYAKPENSYFSTIEKFDKDENKIYEKKYKFKGILARLLYFFAK